MCTDVVYFGRRFTPEQLLGHSTGLRVLYLYSGPERKLDAVALGERLGLTVDAVDILRHDSHDIADQLIWESIVSSFESGHYHGLLLSPPCSTFSIARSGAGGPDALRGEHPPDIYGRSDLSLKDLSLIHI